MNLEWEKRKVTRPEGGNTADHVCLCVGLPASHLGSTRHPSTPFYPWVENGPRVVFR